MKGSEPVRTALILVILACCLVASGCTQYTNYPSGTVRLAESPETSAVVERKVEYVPAPVEKLEYTPPSEYRIGPTDVMMVTVEGEGAAVFGIAPPPSVAAAPGVQTPGAKPIGHQVDEKGYITIPLAGRVKVGGLTVGEAQEQIEKKMKKYIKEPSVIVEITQKKSQPIYLIGQFKASGVYYLDRPTKLVQGVALGKGPDTSANLHLARLVRDKKIVPVDIYALLQEGDVRQNIWLKGGDTIYIPDVKARSVFVFGAVKTPGQVLMPSGGPLSLPQALAIAGLDSTQYYRYARIIRSISTTKGELMVVDIDKIMNGTAAPFMLSEGDIVYVPTSRVANWNAALNDLLPTLNTISGILTPYVDLKFMGGF